LFGAIEKIPLEDGRIAQQVNVEGASGAGKHAMLGLTRTAIDEGRDHDIRVHAICPGGAATGMIKQSRPVSPTFQL
jgi:NAD(P)-dependent dehydrogenase (short-subunit alcohol dehydrogenase family)